jgi:trehalose 6-phosphate phosphatase
MKKSVLFLDYDGTLAPFKIDRQKAFIHPRIKEELELLLQNKKSKVVIISGRSIQDLLPLLRLSVIPELWGNHGLERRTVGGRYTKGKISPLQKKGLLIAVKMCEKHLHPQNYEIKPFSVAVHVRGFKPLLKKQTLDWFTKFWNEEASGYDLELIASKEACELRVKGKNKGTAVAEVLAALPKDAQVAYLGDDMTDEDAFEALGDRGLKVLVGKKRRPTKADILIKTYVGVAKFLQKWRNSLDGQ